MSTDRRVALFRIALCGPFALLSQCALAATVTKCIHNVTELHNALVAASSSTNTNDYVLQLREGLYLVPSGGLTFDQSTNHSLDMEGGFYPSSGSTGCEHQRLKAATTKLDGRGNQQIFTVKTEAGVTSGNVTVRYLTFQNAGSVVSALAFLMGQNASAVRVDNTFVADNTTSYPTVEFESHAGKVYFIDNAVVDNIGGGNLQSDVAVDFDMGASAGVVAYINNNTIAGNVQSPLSDYMPVGILLNGSAGFDLANNIIRNDGSSDVWAFGSPPPAVTFDRDDIHTYLNIAPQTGAKTIDKDPLFVDSAHGNYRLLPPSPAVERGDNSPPAGTRAVDLDGNPRVVGTVDLGAYELPDLIFADGFQ